MFASYAETWLDLLLQWSGDNKFRLQIQCNFSNFSFIQRRIKKACFNTVLLKSFSK